jgi:hypothetical protein
MHLLQTWPVVLPSGKGAEKSPTWPVFVCGINQRPSQPKPLAATCVGRMDGATKGRLAKHATRQSTNAAVSLMSAALGPSIPTWPALIRTIPSDVRISYSGTGYNLCYRTRHFIGTLLRFHVFPLLTSRPRSREEKRRGAGSDAAQESSPRTEPRCRRSVFSHGKPRGVLLILLPIAVTASCVPSRHAPGHCTASAVLCPGARALQGM